MKRKLLIICPYPENVAPSQRLKYEQYFPYFREAGYDITVSPFISIGFWKIIYQPGYIFQKVFFTLLGYLNRFAELITIPRYDVVYVHLWATPFGPPVFEWMIRKLSKKMIYDIDDLVYLKDAQTKSHPLVRYIKGRQKPLYLMSVANHVITCTPHLDNFVRQYNQCTTDISSTINTEAYQPVNSYSNSNRLTIGWSGSLSTSKYFYLLENVLKELGKKYDFNILVIGDPNVRIEGLNLEAISWVEVDEVKNLQRLDIGLYPLPNEEWVLGKSGLKALQYMALGIPTVATAIGANFRVIENGESGFLVNTDGEWVNALSKLIENPELRKEIGEKARARVEALYSINANKKVYLNILKEV